jgi:glutamyl-tRNA reductase
MICGLTVFHATKAGPVAGTDAAWTQLKSQASGSVWSLDTCQRRLLVSLDPQARQQPVPPGVQRLHDSDAYEFLLRVATGLASQLAGETNIFGQLKAVWNRDAPKTPWLQWLFADAKEIRARHLSEVGGASYGRTVRQLLRQPGREPLAGPILLVGAGDMAESVAPWLRSWPLQVLNRTEARAETLVAQLREQPGEAVNAVPVRHQELAWRSAGAVVVCIPVDVAADALLLQWLERSLHGSGVPVIHLGVHRAQAGCWAELADFRCLDDVFALQSRADERRDRQLAAARMACSERARHRALGLSLSHPHGWEDLPAFFAPAVTEAPRRTASGAAELLLAA